MALRHLPPSHCRQDQGSHMFFPGLCHRSDPIQPDPTLLDMLCPGKRGAVPEFSREIPGSSPSSQAHSPTPTSAGAVGSGLQAIKILNYLFGKASDFFMTLSHQRLSMQLVLAAVRYLKSSMCSRALINQGIAETNLKIKNIQRVKGRVISYCSPAIFAGYSRYTDLLPDSTAGGECPCMPWGKAGRAQSPAGLSPEPCTSGWGKLQKQKPTLCCLQVQVEKCLV